MPFICMVRKILMHMCVRVFFFLLNFLFNKVKKLVENVFWWRGHGFKSFASERITFSVLRKWAFSPTQITEKMNQIPDLGYKSHREHEMLHGILLQWLPPASQSPLQTLGYSRNAVHFWRWKKRGLYFSWEISTIWEYDDKEYGHFHSLLHC